MFSARTQNILEPGVPFSRPHNQPIFPSRFSGRFLKLDVFSLVHHPCIRAGGRRPCCWCLCRHLSGEVPPQASTSTSPRRRHGTSRAHIDTRRDTGANTLPRRCRRRCPRAWATRFLWTSTLSLHQEAADRLAHTDASTSKAVQPFASQEHGLGKAFDLRQT